MLYIAIYEESVGNPMVNNLCNQIIRCGEDLEKCISDLELLQETIKSAKNKRTLIKHTSEIFMQYLFAQVYFDLQVNKVMYKYLDKTKSLGIFVSSLMAEVGTDNKVSAFYSMLNIVLSYLKRYHLDVPGSGELISKEAVESIMSLSVAKDLSCLLVTKRPILILNVDCTCEYNSTSLPYLNIITNSRTNPLNGEGNNVDYVFMHELGHLFHAYLVNTQFVAPEGFDAVIANAFGNDINNLSKEDIPEVFADCFSIACASGTPYEKTNPFMQIFQRDHCEYITTYIKNLIQKEMMRLEGFMQM